MWSSTAGRLASRDYSTRVDLFWFGVSNLIVPLAVWSGIFVAAAVVVAVPTGVWCGRRIRRARASGRMLSTPRVLLLWLLAVAGLFAIPAAIAVIHAVPFAIERGLAQILERSAPEAAVRITDLASSHVASLIGVGDDHTLVDVGALQARTEAALEELREAASSRSGFARVYDIAATMCLRAVQAALADAGPADGRVSWHDVNARTKTILSRSASVLVADTVVSLHLAAWTNVVSALGFVALSHVLTVAVCFLLVRPMIRGGDATNRQDDLSRNDQPRRPEAGTAVGDAVPDRSSRSSVS